MILKIDSPHNHLIKKVNKLLVSRAFRYTEGLFVIEGLRLSTDAVKSGMQIDTLLFTDAFAQKHGEELALLQKNSDRCVEISRAVESRISDTQNPQGIFCVCRLPKNKLSVSCGKRYIALENIQDPSNLGTIARTAEALGADGLILSRDCCDCYNPKVVRGSMGAFFRLPFVQTDDFCAFLRNAKESGFQVVATSPDRNSEDIAALKRSDSVIAVIGNEGEGITDGAFECADNIVTIKMRGRAESLNASAAAAIVMYEVLKQG